MPRTRLRPLDAYPFAMTITVRTTDLNYGGHLGNDRLLSLVHEARVAFLASRGWTELDCAGAGLIMSEAVIAFQAEAFAGDELEIACAAVEPERSGFRLCHRLTRCADGRAIALVETQMVCFDYATRRVVALPTAVAESCVRRED